MNAMRYSYHFPFIWTSLKRLPAGNPDSPPCSPLSVTHCIHLCRDAKRGVRFVYRSVHYGSHILRQSFLSLCYNVCRKISARYRRCGNTPRLPGSVRDLAKNKHQEEPHKHRSDSGERDVYLSVAGTLRRFRAWLQVPLPGRSAPRRPR